MRVNAREEKYESVELFGKPALFTNNRVSRATVPAEFICYDLRGSDNDPGRPTSLESKVSVNHAGTILSPQPIRIPESGYRRIGGKLNFLSEQLTLADFCERQGLTLSPDPHKYMLRPATADEASLFYSMSPEQDVEFGTVGHLRQDFGSSGVGFYTTWWEHNDNTLNTAEFKAEFDEVVDEFRRYGPLKTRGDMSAFCYDHGGKLNGGNYYGYIAESENYRYALRCCSDSGDYNAYLYVFDKRQQEPNMTMTEESGQQPQEGMTMGGMVFE